MKKVALLICILTIGAVAQLIYARNNPLINTTLIWKGENYAAFTSLIEFDNNFYCTFREAKMHVDMSGADTGHIVILCSKNGNKWEKYRVVDEAGYDLRDPQLFINSDKHLNLLVEKVKYVNNNAKVRQSCYLDLMDNHIGLNPITFDNNIKWNWLWNVNAVNSTLYGFTYAPFFALYRSTTGRHYEHVSTPKIENQPTEGAIIDLNKKTLLAVVRRSDFAAIGKSYDNGKTWHWKQSDHKIACPKLIRAKGKIILTGRNYGKIPHTSIFVYDKKKDDFDVIYDLPDSGDCSYPGIIEKNGYLYISYYQSQNKKYSDIYITKVKI